MMRMKLDRTELAIVAAMRTICTGSILFGVMTVMDNMYVTIFASTLIAMDILVELARKDLRRDEREKAGKGKN